MTPRLVIGTVHPDLIDAEYCRCLVETLPADTTGHFPFRERVLLSRAPAGMIHVARNEIVRSFLSHPMRPARLLFVDTDITWTPDQVWQLVERADSEDHHALSGLVYDQTAMPMLYNGEMRQVPVAGYRQRVFATGLGFMLLSRDLLMRCFQRYGWPAPWFDYGHRHGKMVSEDVVFAQRCEEMGVPVMACL